MKEPTPRMLLTNSTMVGRIYGQSTQDECLFDVVLDPNGDTTILIRSRAPGGNTSILMPAGSRLLVQIFEQPSVLWLMHAGTLNHSRMMYFIPLESIESQDGSEIPSLAETTLEQVDEGVHDAMDDRDRR